jgi:hypothetical protein
MGEIARASPAYARRLFDRAQAALNRSEALGQDQQDRNLASLSALRRFRVRSESAALNLFRAVYELCWPAETRDLNASAAVKQAAHLLAECAALRADLPTINVHASSDAHKYLARQYLVNSSACFLLRLMTGADADALRAEPICATLLEEIESARDVFDKTYSPILLLELAAFEHLFGAGRAPSQDLVKRARSESALEIDFLITDLIFDLLQKTK